MKIFCILLAALIMTSCEPEWVDPFETFRIEQGSHGKFGRVQSLISSELNFKVIFDETAIYTAGSEENQHDIHKLLGFSDCNSMHHDNSARFGWRWVEDKLEIHAYCYASGVRSSEYIGDVNLNEENNYRLTLEDEHYVFKLNDLPEVKMQRNKPCDRGFYYMLWPYFGGDEVAPHDVSIKILLAY